MSKQLTSFFTALILLCRVTNRPFLATTLGVIDIFAKETVALVTMAPAIAVLMSDPNPRRWRVSTELVVVG